MTIFLKITLLIKLLQKFSKKLYMTRLDKFLYRLEASGAIIKKIERERE